MFLKPSKYTKVEKSTLFSCGLIMSALSERDVIDYEKLRFTVAGKSNDMGANFLPALNVLFLLGKIEYVEKLDQIIKV